MRFKVLAGLAALSTILSACNFGGLGGSSALDASQAVDPNTKPIQVTTTLDESHATSAEIGPDGGTLSTTAADGTRFTLDIPAKALVETIEVQMIPLSSMEGLPWKSGPVAAVQLEPDGQTFYDYVTLTIQPSGDIPADQFIPVGSSGQDHNLYIPMVDPKSKGLHLKLDHFSSAGATKGFLADIEPWRQRLGGDVEARLSSIAAAEMAAFGQRAARGEDVSRDMNNFWEWLIPTWKQYVLIPRLAAARDSCAAGKLAIQTVLNMARSLELMGRGDELGVNLTDLLPGVGRVCIKEEYELCRDQHIIHRMIPAILGMERQAELLGMNEPSPGGSPSAMAQVEAYAWDLASKCLNFELQFTSNVTMGTGDGSFTSKVEATIKIQLESPGMLGMKATGSGPLENTDYELKPNRCSATGITGGGTFQVLGLTWDNAPPDAGRPYGHVTAIHLTYDPGKTSESATVTCAGHSSKVPPTPMWTMAYEALHMNEMSGTPGGSTGPSIPDIGSLLGGSGIPNIPGLPGASNLPGMGGQSQPGSGESNQGSGMTFLAKEWAVRGGELFASKQWQTSVNMTTVGTEDGTFKLYHKPQ